MMALLLLTTSSYTACAAATAEFVQFGIITDVHYADAAPLGTRIYRDSLPKVQQAVQTMGKENVDFMIELGDFKDTDVSQHCDKDPSPACAPGLTPSDQSFAR